MRTIVPFVLALAIPFALQAQPGVPPTIDAIEKKIAEGHETVQDRVTLMNLYMAGRDVEGRRREALWLIGHRPEVADPRNIAFNLGPSGNLPDPEGQETAFEMWRANLAKPNAPARVIANGAWVFRFEDRAFAWNALRKAEGAHPRDPDLARVRGMLDVMDMCGFVESGTFQMSSDPALRDSPAAKHSREDIDTSTDARVIAAASDFLLQQRFVLNRPFDGGAPPFDGVDPLDIAEKWMLRATQLDPENKDAKAALARVYQNEGGQAADPKWRVELFQKADSLVENSFVLPQLALAEFEAGDDDAAAKTAQRMLDRTPPQPNFINMGHTVLGLVALDQKRMADAKKELLESARVKGNFEPNRTLAQALVDAGERDIVIEYLNLCRDFWLLDQGRIDHYIRLIRAPGTHDILGFYLPGQDLRGREAPKLPADVLDGDYKGKTVALQFRNDSCKDCAAEFAIIDKLSAAHGVTAAAIDAADHQALLRQFEVETFPTVVLINSQGRIAGYLSGRVNENTLLANLEQVAGRSPQQRLPAPVPTGLLAWKPVAGAESYIVQLDQKDAKGWQSDRDQHLVRVIPVAGTSATLDESLGETSSPRIRWRVFAVTTRGPGLMSEWREESLDRP